MDNAQFIDAYLPLVPALPLAAAILVATLGPLLSRGLGRQQFWIALPVIVALAVSCLFSLQLVQAVAREQQRAASATGTLPRQAGYERIVTLWTWASVEDAYVASGGAADFHIDVALRADALTAMMLAMVTFISTLVAIFAAGYMAGDRGYWRFFAYLGLFVFSMTMLVSVSNFVLLYVFWEAVGVCSYLLIGFWYEKREAAAAGMKAFLVNRVGDFGFALGLFLIWTTYGTLNFHDVPRFAPAAAEPAAASVAADATTVRGVLGQSRLAANDFVTGDLATLICLLLLLGACGKSAQFPLHVWLPDAMEGPTPVSALIHAATMVTAGVYMVARCSPLFAASPEAQVTVSVVGGFTALLAALIALTQFDLKRVLAYSTISQLGYMFLGLGTGLFAGVTGGMFHLFTHAFFKALLFLAAGSVMHAMGGVIDMRKYGGLRRIMPHTHWTFLIGCLALAGVFPLAGFWSKDAVLASVHDKVHQLEHVLEARHGVGAAHEESAATTALQTSFAGLSDRQLSAYGGVYWLLYYTGLFTAFLTGLYAFRAFCLTFYGLEQIPEEAHGHAHESPPVMLAPLAVLAFGSMAVGIMALGGWLYVGDFFRGRWGQTDFADYLAHTPSLAAGALVLTIRQQPEFHISVAAMSTLAAILGIGLALYLYLGERSEVRWLKRLLDMEGAERFTDPQWVAQLQRVGWIAALARSLHSIGRGFVVALVGSLLGAVTLILALPILLLSYVSPYKLSAGKFFFDEIYAALVVTPLSWLAAACDWIDRKLVDGLVDLAGSLAPAAGSLMRSLQVGLVQFYAIAMVLGALILIAARWWAG
jgi:NADH-quinone oxidoreductase subunit L